MAKVKKCNFCNGTGKILIGSYFDQQRPCKKCNGKGTK